MRSRAASRSSGLTRISRQPPKPRPRSAQMSAATLGAPNFVSAQKRADDVGLALTPNDRHPYDIRHTASLARAGHRLRSGDGALQPAFGVNLDPGRFSDIPRPD